MYKFLLVIILLFSAFSTYSKEKIKIGTFEFPKGKVEYLEKIFKKYQELGVDRVYYHVNVKSFKQIPYFALLHNRAPR